MIIKVGGCFGSELPGYRSTGFTVNGRLLLDAGTVTSTFTWDEQLQITDVCLSHLHLDHVKELAFLADNRAGRAARPLSVCGTRGVIAGLRKELFNDRIWPDFARIPSRAAPVISYRVLPEGRYSVVGGLRCKPVPVNHPVAAAGYLIREPGCSVLYTGDTGPTRAIWRAGRALPDLKAVIAEVSFPSGMEELAVASGHLTPTLLERELEQLGRPAVQVYVFHMKPLHVDTITAELRAMRGRRIEPLHQNRSYRIG